MLLQQKMDIYIATMMNHRLYHQGASFGTKMDACIEKIISPHLLNGSVQKNSI